MAEKYCSSREKCKRVSTVINENDNVEIMGNHMNAGNIYKVQLEISAKEET